MPPARHNASLIITHQITHQLVTTGCQVRACSAAPQGVGVPEFAGEEAAEAGEGRGAVRARCTERGGAEMRRPRAQEAGVGPARFRFMDVSVQDSEGQPGGVGPQAERGAGRQVLAAGEGAGRPSASVKWSR